MIVAAAPYLGPDMVGGERLAMLAVPAAAEALAPLAALGGGPVPVFVGMPPVRPGRPADAAVAVVDRLRGVRAGQVRVGRVEPIEAGHAAGAMAVQKAWETVRRGADFALAGGVDSYLYPETLEWLEANEQVHSTGPQNNAYGFVPGEAAGFVLLASAAAVERYKLPAALELVTAATTREEKLIKTDAVCTGEGMTALFRALASGQPPGSQADYLYCDLNGEPYRADEFGFAVVRAGGLFRDPSAFAAPADCWGDVGASSGPLFLTLADAAARKGYARGPVTAAFTSSESGERAGFVVRHRPLQGGR
jgi:3-oxoacyl-[acyl-carrier-protein] synthase-1